MTAKERIVAALHDEPVDRMPFSPFLAYVWEYFPRDVQDAVQLAFHHGAKVGDTLGIICGIEPTMFLNLEGAAPDRYRTVSAQLKNEPGTQDLCFVFRGQDAAESMRLNWWRTNQAKNASLPGRINPHSESIDDDDTLCRTL